MKKLINKYQVGGWFPIGYDNNIYQPTYGTMLPEVKVIAKGDPRKVNNDYYKAHSRARANAQESVQQWDDRDRLVLNTMLGVGATPVVAAHPLSFILGLAGGEGVNAGIRNTTKYNDFGEWSSNLITRDNSIAPLTSWLNPGYALAGASRPIIRGVNNIKLLNNIRNNVPEMGEVMFRRINNAAYKDIQQTHVVRPNPKGIYAREGHIQSGTWWSADGATGGGKIRYPGKILVVISEHHPQFPTRTTPGTEHLGYKVGDMEIDAYSPYIEIIKEYDKVIPKKEYIPQLTFKNFYLTNTFNKMLHPFNSEYVRLVTNKNIQNYGHLLSDVEVNNILNKVKTLKLYSNNKYGQQLKTLNEQNLLQETIGELQK